MLSPNTTIDMAKDKYIVHIHNGTNTAVYNPTAENVVIQAPTPTVEGYITVNGVPLTEGLNTIIVAYYNNADADVSTTLTKVCKAIVRKTINKTMVVV